MTETATVAERIDMIRTFVPRLRKVVDGLTAEQLTTQYNPPEWTVAQNVHHLADAHMNAYLRFRLILTQDEAKIVGYDQDAFAELEDGRDANIEDSLLVLEGLHTRWARLLDSIIDWSKSGHHLVVERPVTLERLLDIYAYHGDRHIQQIQEVLEKMP